ncbi:hypothetical protein ACHHYP_04279 [Achlya hypogyna]|uniref:U6 snRNA phosphodiesterase 1 n=1 Tax=Achlya hypogyna TaxID=1202772 RepID=A0A1V9Z1I4_ACHHY|nr:hypothetical protein ACHHYP_04279 [Achlya hypogyna]
MASLVAYSESDSSSSDEDAGPCKRQRVGDAPTWTRNFAHVDGNWPSYVYFNGAVLRKNCHLIPIVVPMTAPMRTMMEHAIEQVDKAYAGRSLELISMDDPRSRPKKDTNENPSFHLSLSRTFVLTFDQIEPFVKALRLALKYRKRQRVGFQGHRILINDERTRLFAAIPVIQGKAEVCHIIACVDRVMVEFGLEPYYANPVPHVSVASTPVVPDENAVETKASTPPPVVYHDCSVVAVTIGNKHYQIPLLR